MHATKTAGSTNCTVATCALLGSASWRRGTHGHECSCARAFFVLVGSRPADIRTCLGTYLKTYHSYRGETSEKNHYENQSRSILHSIGD
eukprot:6178840-Pleurochrysis_carterae.AAC.1